MISLSRRKILLLVCAPFLAYLNSFWGSFQFDDYNVIVNNPQVHSMVLWLSDLSYGIRPLLKLSYALNWVSGAGEFGFHIINLLIHISNTILVYVISKRFSDKKELPSSDYIALITALLFALHPVQTEAVTYISGRSASLMTMLYLSSMFAYITGAQTNRKIFLYLVSPALFVMAVLIKETALTLPLALLLWDITCNQGNTFRASIRRQAAHWILLVIITFSVVIHPNYSELLEYSFNARTLKDNLLSQINGVSYLITKFFLLSSLNIDPDLHVISAWTTKLFLKALIIVSLAGTAAYFLKKKHWVGFGLLWFFLHLLPTNSFVPRLDIANERHLYLPAFGIFLMIGILIGNLKAKIRMKKEIFNIGTAAILIVLGLFTIKRNQTYKSEIALWEDTARKSPQKARVHNNLGYAYALAGMNEKAKDAYIKALALKPDYELARNNLNMLLSKEPADRR